MHTPIVVLKGSGMNTVAHYFATEERFQEWLSQCTNGERIQIIRACIYHE